jgi:hypothetical protein
MLLYALSVMRATSHWTETEFEYRLLARIRIILRSVVIFNWVAVLAVMFMHGVPNAIGLSVFTLFRATAICATLWFVFEIIEVLTGRTSAKNPVTDALLTLPMFGFWFLAWASSF